MPLPTATMDVPFMPATDPICEAQLLDTTAANCSPEALPNADANDLPPAFRLPAASLPPAAPLDGEQGAIDLEIPPSFCPDFTDTAELFSAFDDFASAAGVYKEATELVHPAEPAQAAEAQAAEAQAAEPCVSAGEETGLAEALAVYDAAVNAYRTPGAPVQRTGNEARHPPVQPPPQTGSFNY